MIKCSANECEFEGEVTEFSEIPLLNEQHDSEGRIVRAYYCPECRAINFVATEK